MPVLILVPSNGKYCVLPKMKASSPNFWPGMLDSVCGELFSSLVVRTFEGIKVAPYLRPQTICGLHLSVAHLNYFPGYVDGLAHITYGSDVQAKNLEWHCD